MRARRSITPCACSEPVWKGASEPMRCTWRRSWAFGRRSWGRGSSPRWRTPLRLWERRPRRRRRAARCPRAGSRFSQRARRGCEPLLWRCRTRTWRTWPPVRWARGPWCSSRRPAPRSDGPRSEARRGSWSARRRRRPSSLRTLRRPAPRSARLRGWPALRCGGSSARRGSRGSDGACAMARRRWPCSARRRAHGWRSRFSPRPSRSARARAPSSRGPSRRLRSSLLAWT